MIGTDPGILLRAKRLAMAIIAARPFFFSTVLYLLIFSSLKDLVMPIQSNPMSPGIFLLTPRKLSPAWLTPSPSAIMMKAKISPKPPGSSRAHTGSAVAQSSATGAPGKCHPSPSVAQTPVHASMLIRPCLISASSKNWGWGNMLGNAPLISCILLKPMGSKSSPWNSGLYGVDARAELLMTEVAGAKAAAEPARAAKRASFMVDDGGGWG
mmetsp:Transcript_21062/g.37792  ORF Transcript_21062/g.37792 Transcript_21062/m.37792 type:complete len:211 (+) Transcript_21062:387-1019(+)